MRFSLWLAGLLLAFGLSSATAADTGMGRKPAVAPAATVYRVIPRSPEAALVWTADACWRGCAQDCGRHFQACLEAATEGSCVSKNDACDRFCQRECRPYGGPLVRFD
jgi:hypothetical protein